MQRTFAMGAGALVLTAAGISSPAWAHTGADAHASFLSGFVHPLTGADHMLAIVTVGAWAALLGGRAIAALPIGFVASMLGGYALALSGIVLPQVEPMILSSLVIMGLIVASAFALPVPLAVAIAMLFGIVHGHAHGTEIGTAGAAAYAAGFAASTALLHGLGIALSLLPARISPHASVRPAARTIGAATAVGGVVLALT